MTGSVSATVNSRTFQVEFRRGIGFDAALELQMNAHQRLREDSGAPGLLLIAEHTPIVTMGRSGSEENLLQGRAGLEAAGISFHQAKRGGDVTYHGPGQITLYPVFPLEWWAKDIHNYLRRLEDVGIAYLRCHGISGERSKGFTGVWVGNEKIAAIGIAVSRWITYYGMGMNLEPDFRHFSLIRPCGIEDCGITSLSKLTGKKPDLDFEMRRIARVFAEVFAGAKLTGEDFEGC